MSKGNENAFPQGAHSSGLTKREFIAAQLMAGMMANGWLPGWVRHSPDRQRTFEVENFAKAAVIGADALIAALHDSSDETP